MFTAHFTCQVMIGLGLCLALWDILEIGNTLTSYTLALTSK